MPDLLRKGCVAVLAVVMLVSGFTMAAMADAHLPEGEKQIWALLAGTIGGLAMSLGQFLSKKKLAPVPPEADNSTGVSE